MAEENKAWKMFRRDAAMLRDADAVLVITSLRCLTDPADINCNMCGRLTCEYYRKVERLPAGPGVAYTGPALRVPGEQHGLRDRRASSSRRGPWGSTTACSGRPARRPCG